MYCEMTDAHFPPGRVPDIRTLVGRPARDPADRIQDLLYEARSLLYRDDGLERDQEDLRRLRLLLGLLTVHGPRKDRLLRYQLEEMRYELRRSTRIRLAA